VIICTLAVPGFIILTFQGIINGDPNRFVGAFALLAVCALSGGFAGLVYYVTGPLRRQGFLGYYLAWIIVAWSYLVGALGCIALADLVGIKGGIGKDLLKDFTEPLFLGIFGGIGAIIGIFVGASVRNQS
jgi:hypothetical protein